MFFYVKERHFTSYVFSLRILFLTWLQGEALEPCHVWFLGGFQPSTELPAPPPAEQIPVHATNRHTYLGNILLDLGLN